MLIKEKDSLVNILESIEKNEQYSSHLKNADELYKDFMQKSSK
jgi:hypothetical protein